MGSGWRGGRGEIGGVNNDRGRGKGQQERNVNLSKFIEPYSCNFCCIQRVRYRLINLSVTGVKKIVSFPFLFAIAQAVLANELRSQSPLNLCEILGD
jgi:hypothetical protein